MTCFAGAAAASRVFNEALAKIAINAQQGGTTDIGKFICVFMYFWLNVFNKYMQRPSKMNFALNSAISLHIAHIAQQFCTAF